MLTMIIRLIISSTKDEVERIQKMSLLTRAKEALTFENRH
jgi:hypothetical protein